MQAALQPLGALALTDGAVPYPSCTCQHYGQPLENRLLNHQLEQCIDHQSYRLIAYCLHNHVVYVYPGAWVPKMFSSYAPHCRYLSPIRGSKPQALLSCPCASVYPQMPHQCYNPEQVSVCQINGKTYWIGTIMQTSKTTDQLCPKKSGSACWQYDPG